MTFSKAIEIKKVVNSWNRDRKEFGFGHVKFDALMFSDGCWSVDLKPVDVKIFTSLELDELLKLYAKGGFHMVLTSLNNAPIIDMQ